MRALKKRSINIPKDAVHDLIELENDLGRKIIETCLTGKTLASSRRSVSLGIARKTACEKVGENCFLSPHFAHTFSLAVFRAMPELTERLEEANLFLVTHVSIPTQINFRW